MESFVTSCFSTDTYEADVYGSMLQEDGHDVLDGLMDVAASEVSRCSFVTVESDEECKSFEDPLLHEEPQSISFHPHPLTWKIPYGLKNRWICDICQSQHGGKKKGQAEESWHCGLCSFDLCRECFRFVKTAVNYEEGFIQAHYGKERKARSFVEMLPLKKLGVKSSNLLLEEITSKEFLSSLSEMDSDTDTSDVIDQDSIDLRQTGDSSTDCLSTESEDGSVQVNEEVVHISTETIQTHDECTWQSGTDDSISRSDDSLSRTDETLSQVSQGELDTAISEEDIR